MTIPAIPGATMLFAWTFDHDTQATMTAALVEEDGYSRERHRELFSALSFERVAGDEGATESKASSRHQNPFHKLFQPLSGWNKKKSSSNLNHCEDTVDSNTKLSDQQQEVDGGGSSDEFSQRSAGSLVGSLDEDGNVEVVFYDAQQFETDSVDSLSMSPTTNVRGGGSQDSSTSFQSCPGMMAYQGQQPPLPKYPIRPPPPPIELPNRFLGAGKGDPVEGQRRYLATLEWRKERRVDTILRQPNFHFDLIKQHYLHYIHFRGVQGYPCFYEFPAKTNLKALRESGITVDDLLWHYTQVIEFMWQVIDPRDTAKSVYVLDLTGIRMGDFVGDVMDFVKRASLLCNHHYPERAGYVYVINVPRWFNLIWTVVKPLVDEATLRKIIIFRGSPEETSRLLQEKIPLENLPPEYGGLSPPFGQSPEEEEFRQWVYHNNYLAQQKRMCCPTPHECRFCSWAPVRSY